MGQFNHPKTSIAILPFKNNSEDSNLNYLAIGITEDLIVDLSKYSSLQVISTYSSSIAADEMKYLKSLKADYLVKGSFRVNGTDLRINAQLLLASNETIIWSNRYEADINSIFDIQDDIIGQLVSALQREIDINLLSTTKQKPRTNLVAYEYWLMGMQELKKGNLEADNCARELFQEALKIDPTYARAFSGLSLSYFNEWSCQLWERWDYSQKGAFEYALKAIELDDTNYISLTVLGRLYVYKGDWVKAEHFLRKSLRINTNDTDNLIQIASCFVYLGYTEEAENLYLKAMRLNPINTEWYFSYGVTIYFEMGDFRKCIDLGQKIDLNSAAVDIAGYLAASFYHLQAHDKMLEYWKKYLDIFQNKILRGNTLIESEALKWVKNVNPKKGNSNLDPFIDFMKQKDDINLESWPMKEPAINNSGYYFKRDGQLWNIFFDNHSATFPDMKGLNDIVTLLSTPRQEYHCTELMGVPVLLNNQETVIDAKAKKQYRDHLATLQSDIDEALEMNDHVRASHLQEEYDKLVEHLTKSLGFGGKTRKLKTPSEKARSAVTWRIRNAIKKIKKEHDSLGNHLDYSIKTGTFCAYVPEKEITWTF